MTCTTCLFVSLVLLVADAKMHLEKAVLIVGTYQNLSNLDFLDVYNYDLVIHGLTLYLSTLVNAKQKSQ
jgi:hypothetical protein